jgi:hypothetical protein
VYKKRKGLCQIIVRRKSYKTSTPKTRNTDYGVNINEPELQEDFDFILLEMEARRHELQVCTSGIIWLFFRDLSL